MKQMTFVITVASPDNINQESIRNSLNDTMQQVVKDRNMCFEIIENDNLYTYRQGGYEYTDRNIPALEDPLKNTWMSTSRKDL